MVHAAMVTVNRASDVAWAPGLGGNIVPSTTTDSWTGTAGGDWKDAADWSTGQVPGSGNDAVIDTATVQTITYTQADKSVVNSLTVGEDIFTMSAGSLTILTTGSFADGLQQSGGKILAGAITLMGTSSFTGGSIAGSASFSNAGTATLGSYGIYGAAMFANTGTVVQTGAVLIGNGSGTGAAILNQAGTYDITANVNVTGKAASAQFTNEATLEKSGATGTSVIGLDFTNTASGTISALAGNLEFAGKTTALAGALTGPGEISVGAGVVTLAGGTSITAGTFGILGKASVDLGGAVSIPNLFDEASGGNTTLNVGSFALTLTGAGSVVGTGGTAGLTGSGSVVNEGTLTVSGSMGLGKTLSFLNDGTIVDSGNFYFGTGKGVPVVTNAAGATFDLAHNAGFTNKNAAAFSNAGTLAKISGNGVSTLADDVTSTGVITSAISVLDFSGAANSFGGTISGAGAVTFDGFGTTTLQPGLVLSVATLNLDSGATVLLAGAQSFAGKFSDNSTISGIAIDLGHFQLALSGAVTFGGYDAVVNGPGTLSTSGTTTLSVDGLTLDGTVDWQNSGTVSGHAPLTLGGSGSGSVTIVNSATGVFNVNDDFSATVGAAAEASFTNDGLFEQTSTTGVVAVGVDFDNTGRVLSSTGLIDFEGAANSLGGTISGASAVAFDGGGVTTLEPGLVLSVGAIELDAATLALTSNLGYAGGVTSDGNDGPAIMLGTYTLTLSGQDSLDGVTIDGAGTFATSGSTTLSLCTLGGTATWDNTGVISDAAGLTLGDNSGDAVQFVNSASGTYNLVSDDHMQVGVSTNSTFTNDGVFEKTSGVASGGSVIYPNFINAGILDVAAGNLLLQGPTSVIGGTLSGAGTISLSNSTTLETVSKITVNETDLGSGQFTLAADQTVSGTLVILNGYDTISLNGYLLQLAGPFSVYHFNGIGTPVIDGPGTFVTSGASTFSNAINVGSGATWINNGNLNDIGGMGIGDGGSAAASFVNAAGGVFDVGDGAWITMGSGTFSALTNDGLFEKTGGGGSSLIFSEFVNNGTISVSSGTIEFVGYSLGGGNYESLFVDNGAIDPSDVVTYGTNGNVFISAPGSMTAQASLLPDFAQPMLGDARGDTVLAKADWAYPAETRAADAQIGAGVGWSHASVGEGFSATALAVHATLLDHSPS